MEANKMNVSKKTAVLIVDLQKSLTIEGGSNYYPTAAEMMPRVCTQLAKMREAGAQLVYIWTKASMSSGLTCRPHQYNPELSGRLMPEADSSWMELDDRLPIGRRRGRRTIGPRTARHRECARLRHQDKCLLSPNHDRFCIPRL